MEPKLSIIVPVYNVERYLDRCLNSILNQTFTDFELVLINDGSTDNSGSICDEYAKKDIRVRVMHKKNGGLSSARNLGIKSSRGSYIGFVDSDDWIEEDMFEVMIKSCLEKNADISIIGFKEISESGVYLQDYVPSQNITLSEILKRAYAWNKIYKRDLFFKNNLFFIENKCYEDLELIPKLIIKSKIITTIDKASYNYLKRTGSITGTRNEKILDNLWAYTSIINFLNEKKIYESYKYEFEKAVKYFKKYYSDILFDYPTLFLFKHHKRILNDFKQIGGLSICDFTTFLIKHFEYKCRLVGHTFKSKKRKQNI